MQIASQRPDLDPTTAEVRAFYEEYPYPSHCLPMLRTGFDARLITSFSQQSRPPGKSLSILDAGCGRGVSLLTTATLHPEAHVVGADICRASLEDCRAAAQQRGLQNVQLAEVDLMSLDGLTTPDGGFDLIYSSGVIHHLSDPVAGLSRLCQVLAPHGSLVLMVYGTIGRRGIKRVMRALAQWVDKDAPLSEQLASSRLLVEELAVADDPNCPWYQASVCPDPEFVDRYLHPNETDYDVPALFDLIDAAGLRFHRWLCPEDWSLEGHMPPGTMRDTIEALPERERYTMIEQIVRPKNIEVLITKPGNSARRLPPLKDWGDQTFAVNPEVQFESTARNLWRQSRFEGLSYSLRGSELRHLPLGNLRKAAAILSSQNEPFKGKTLLTAMVEDGVPQGETLATLFELVDAELLYCPHEIELM